MKVIFTGPWYITDTEYIEEAFLFSCFEEYGPTLEVVTNMENVLDKYAKQFARKNRFWYHEIPPKWAEHGPEAFKINRDDLIQFSSGLIAVWDGECRDTYKLIEMAQSNDLLTYVYMVGKNGNHLKPLNKLDKNYDLY